MSGGTDELDRIIARHGRVFERFQHLDLHRKVLLRKRMLRWAAPGPAYCPFIGDGDLPARMYTDRLVLGADNDPGRIEAAHVQLDALLDPAPHLVVADCHDWPFPYYAGPPIAVADIDPYGSPFECLRSFWEHAPKAPRLLVFITDGLRLDLIRKSRLHHPDGRVIELGRFATSEAFNKYLSKWIWPWFDEYVKPYRVLARMRYQRNIMVYWAVALERPRGRPRAREAR